MAQQGLERIPYAVGPDFRMEPVRARFPEQSESAVSLVPDSFIPDATPEPKPVATEDPGYTGDIWRGLKQGAQVQLPKMAGQALQFFGADGLGKSMVDAAEARATPDMQESAVGRAEKSPYSVRGNVYEAATNAVPSLAPGAAGAAAGAAVGSVVPGVGTALGALAGYALGSVAALPMFYGSQAKESYDAVKANQLQQGKSESEADAIARRTAHAEGAIEAGGELVADVIPFAKLFKPFAKPVGNAIVKSALVPTIKGGAKTVGGVVAAEVGTEMAQHAGQNAVRKSMGGTGPGATWEETQKVIMPTALMSVIPGMAGAGAKHVQQSAALRALMSPDTDPETRSKIAMGAAEAIKAGSPEVSKAFAAYAADQIAARAPIEIADDAFYASAAGPRPVEGTFIPADRSGPPAAAQGAGGDTFTQDRQPLQFARPALPAPAPLEGDILGPQALPAGQAMLPPGAIDSTATEIKDAAPAPTLRQQALSRGLLNHSARPSPDMLKRLMRIDDGMAQRLYNEWAAAQVGPQQKVSPTDGGQDGQGQETAQEVSAADDDLTIPLPKSLERMTPGNRSLYKVDEIISSLPRLRTNLVISDSPDQRGVAYTPEKAMRQLLANRDNINDQDGKLRSGNRTGATTGMLLENIKHYHSTANDIRASRQESPQMWADYAARQAEVQKLNIGDAVLAPYGGPEDPFGAPAVIVKKNPKNWKVRYTTGVESELSLPPATLRPAPKVGADGTALDAAAHKAATSPLNDLPQPWIDSGKTKKPIAYKEPKGTAKPAAATAKAGPASFGKVGPAPGAARAISLKDNGDGTATVMAGDEPFYDFDSGDPVRVPADAKPSVVKQSIIDAGAVTSKDRWFGVNDGETLTKPASEVDKAKPADDLSAMFDDVLAEETGNVGAVETAQRINPGNYLDKDGENEWTLERSATAGDETIHVTLNRGKLSERVKSITFAELQQRIKDDADFLRGRGMRRTDTGGYERIAEEAAPAADHERFERAMRAAATTKPTTGESGYVQTTALRYVAFADALKIARDAVAAGVKPVPAQFHTRLDLTMDSALRLIDALGAEPRTAGQAAASAAKNTAAGLADAIDGLGALFGSNGSRLSSGLTFDEETYKKAKPLFQQAIAHFKDAGADLKEAMRAVVRLVLDKFGPQVAENMKPYVVRFMEDVRDGKLNDDGNKPSAYRQVAQEVRQALEMRRELPWQYLFQIADKAFGGTQAEGKYDVKSAYDAMEMGVNLYLMDKGITANESAAQAASMAKTLHQAIQILPTQTKRTAEQDEFQQFSTPPALAYVASWAANINERDVLMEPSAGTGDLAIYAHNKGAALILNELSSRRAGILKELFPSARIFTENAEQLNNVLPDDAIPTVVVMNPPFSSTAGRVEGKRDTMNGAKHIEQALKRLPEGGRLVAIVGEGMAHDRPAFKDWWKRIQSQYNVRANIGISGKEYAKYGTTFDNQILVIDKSGSTINSVVTGKVESVSELPALLEGIRNDRPSVTERLAIEPESGKAVEIGRANAGQADTTGGTATDAVGNGSGRNQAGRGNADGRLSESGNAADSNAAANNDGVSDQDGQRGRVSNRPGRDGTGRGGSNAAAGIDTGDAVATGEAGGVTVGQTEKQKPTGELTNSVFEQYQPQRMSVPGAKAHPGKLVQSAAMASVEPPSPGYTPNLPKAVIDKGLLSLAQIESVVYAGQAHSQYLPSGERRGFFIGDGTGVGKGREISGIILDNMRQGRQKAVWISFNEGLLNDAQRDFSGVGGDPKLLFFQGKIKPANQITAKHGILFTSYSTLKSGEKKQANDKGQKAGRSRLDQIVEWAGEDFDGVIVFDEAHSMGNVVEMKGKRGKKKPSQQAIAGVNLQKRLPKARIVYVSATGATEISNLGYASRLGLWGENTAFSDVKDFIGKISEGGVAAMELISRDMKAMGMYIARSLSFDGVTYQRLDHELTDLQTDIYNELAKAWQTVLQNVDAALKLTDGAKNGGAKSAAMSAFWGAHQRFFNQVITSLQTPTVIEDMQKQIAEGNAVVVQLVNTNEATQEREVAKAQADGTELEELDFTPRQMLMDYVRNSFPVQAYEESTDDEGNTIYKPVMDANGNPVFDKEAIAMREKLLENLEQIRVPENPLDAIIQAFGSEKVGEVTGRKRRFVQTRDENGNLKVVEEKRGKHASHNDAVAFQADKKPILIFSQAGGTGYSFHADNTAKNQRKRIHYILQPGWRADSAVQGFGRTHRTNQASEPHYVLPTTNLKAQKRFVSSIARRLDQLGALTRGQRQTTSQGLFTASDNLESKYASDALDVFFQDMYRGETSLDFNEISKAMGFDNLVDKKTGGLNTSSLPEIPQFLNRLLSLQSDQQDAVFSEFEKRLEEVVNFAIQQGTYDNGLQTLKADSIVKVRDEVAFTDQRTGAETRYVEVDVTNPVKYRSWEKAKEHVDAYKKQFDGWYKDAKSGKVFGLIDLGQRVNSKGETVNRGAIFDIRDGRQRYIDNVDEIKVGKRWNHNSRSYEVFVLKIDEAMAEAAWTAQIDAAPKQETKREHLIVGVILPIWDRVKGHPRIYRLQTDEGERMIGRIIGPKDVQQTLKNLGLGSTASKMTPPQIIEQIRKGAKAILANGWEISTSTVSGEKRIEITKAGGFLGGDKSVMLDQGVFFERIQWQDRAFIPAGEDGIAVFSRVTASKPVVELIGGKGMESRAAQDSIGTAGRLAITQAKSIVAKFLDEFKRAADLDIRIVASPDEIPARYRPSRYAEGVYHSDIGTIWLVTDNLMRGGRLNASRTFQVLLHEAVGHHGMAAMMGDKFKSLKARVLATAKAKGSVVDDYYKPGDEDYATVEAVRLRYPDATDDQVADEVLARMAETDPGRTLFGYVRAVVRQWLRDVARKLGIQLDTTVAELNDLVALASAYMRRGAGMPGERAPSGVVAASRSQAHVGSPEWARAMRDQNEIPEGWYVHGRARRDDLNTGNVIQMTRDWGVAEQYAGKKGSQWLIRPTHDAKVLDFSSKYSKDMNRVVKRAIQDFDNGTLEFLSWIEGSLGREATADDVDAAVRESFAPDDIVNSAQAYDNWEFAGWLVDRFGVDFVKTPDGAVAMDGNTAIEAVMVPDEGVARNTGEFSDSPSILESRARPGANEAIWDAPDPTTADNVIYTLQDKHIDLKRVQAAIKDAIGQELPDQIDPYLQEELFHGRAAKATEEFLDRELQPLIGEMKQRGIGMDSLETYLWARHAAERNAQIAKINPDMPDGGSGLTDKQARDVLAGKDVTVGGQTVKGIDPAKLRGHAELARKIDMMVAGNRLLLELYELETPSTLAAWKGAYQHYVPLHREDVDSPWAGPGTGQGYSVRGASTKRATGSYRPVENILANLVMQRKRIITRGEKNRVAQALYGLATVMENRDFWKVDDVPKTRVPKEMAIYHVMDGDTEVANYTRMSEADKHAAKIPGGYVYQSWGERVVEQDDPMFRSRPNVVWARFGGEDRFVIFNERDERAMRLAGALKNLDADDISHFLGEVSRWTRYFASINTQYNPVFGVVNLTRDTGTGLLNLKSTPLEGKQAEMLGHVWQALPAIYRAIRIDREGGTPTGTWAELWEEFQEVGGQTGYRDMFRNATEQRDALEAALDPKWWQRKTWGKVISAGGLLAPAEQALLEKAGKPVLDWLSDYNTTMENAIRLSAYKVARDHGMSRERAASLAKNLTVNFNRKGQAARQLGALYAFFNASVQGTARMLETLTHGRQPGKALGRAGKQIVYGGLLLGSMQAMWLAAAGFDDDEPPEFVRDRAIIIPLPDKRYLSVPLPLGFHVLPALGRIGTEQVLNGFKAPGRAAFHVLDVMADAFNPIGNAGMSMQTLAPTVLDPAAALAENKDWTGKQIYRENFSQLDPKPGHQRTKDTATAMSKWLSQALNSLTGGTEFQPGGLSPTPDQIDYLIGQVTGGVGREISKLAQTGGAMATGEELPAYKIPLLGRFYGDAKGQAAVSSRFYENLKAMNMHQAEFMGLAKSDRGEQAKAYLEGHPEASMFREADRMQRYVGKLQDEKRKAIADRMPSAKVKEIDAKITEAMQGFNARVAARRAPAVPAQ